jgi:hypothetical protein
MFPSLDKLNNSLIEKLRGFDGSFSYEDNRRDQVIFILPLSEVSTRISYPSNGYSLNDLIGETKDLCSDALKIKFKEIVEIIAECDMTSDVSKILSWYTKSELKPRTSTKLYFDTGDRVNLSVVTNLYICSHYNCSDLPRLSDFEDFKRELSIVNKCFLTLARPLKIYNTAVYLRDTKLLAPSGKGRLDKIGELYSSEGDYRKRELSS